MLTYPCKQLTLPKTSTPTND